MQVKDLCSTPFHDMESSFCKSNTLLDDVPYLGAQKQYIKLQDLVSHFTFFFF